MSTLNFDTAGIDPAVPHSPVPPGEYILEIEDTDLRPTKSGEGEYLSVTFSIADGPHLGRKVFENFNLSNPNPEAERIARSQFAALCIAAGKAKVGDSIELHGTRIIGSVGVEKRKDSGELRNRVRGYQPLGGAFVAGVQSARPPAPPKPAGSAPPWATGKAAA